VDQRLKTATFKSTTPASAICFHARHFSTSRPQLPIVPERKSNHQSNQKPRELRAYTNRHRKDTCILPASKCHTKISAAISRPAQHRASKCFPLCGCSSITSGRWARHGVNVKIEQTWGTVNRNQNDGKGKDKERETEKNSGSYALFHFIHAFPIHAFSFLVSLAASMQVTPTKQAMVRTTLPHIIHINRQTSTVPLRLPDKRSHARQASRRINPPQQPSRPSSSPNSSPNPSPS
jgi:hypothetical protein